MIYYTLPGDTFSSVLGKHLAGIGAPDIDTAAAWLAYTCPGLLAARGPAPGTPYAILSYVAGGVVYA